MAMLCSVPAVAEHGGTKEFERRNREAREATNGKVQSERLKAFWDDGVLYFKNEGSEGWWKVGLEDGKKEKVDKRPDTATEKKEKAKNGRRRRPPGGRPLGKPESPDGAWRVRVKDGKVELTGESDKNGPKVLEIERPDGWVLNDRVLWSPNSDRFVVWRRPNTPIRQVHYVRSSPEGQLQPEHFMRTYPKPGDELNVPRAVVCFTDDRDPILLDEKLVKNPHELRRHRWRADGTRLTLEFIERGFGIYRVVEIDTEKRSQRTLVEETSQTFVYVSGKTFRHDLDDGAEIVWMSERDGWNHLYLMNGTDGSVKRQLTKGAWIVREVVKLDEEAGTILIKLGGYHEGQDPYFIHWARVRIADGTMTLLTEGDGTHELEFSPDGNYYVDRWSRADQPPVHELRKTADGTMVAELARADAKSLVESGWMMPEPFTAKDRNGKFDIWGVILRPRGFDPAKKYPVVERIYAGPQGSFVPKKWSRWYGTASEMCEAGFMVVLIDGLGTSNRCREFHHFCYQNLKDAGLPDRIAWMKAAAAKYPQMNLERVGIFGGSAGGQSTLGALLFHGDFYKAGAADCGCHDNRMDKMWWNEQWMDWPIGPEYAANSNATHAAKLRGDLLLTVGEVDTNVDPSSTMQVVDALIRADKDFQFYIVPNGGHGVGESPFLRRIRVEFFQRTLQGE
jgi:dipeptidyl-peptidase-4